MEKDDSIFLILLDDIRSDHKIEASFYNEDAFLLALLDVVVFDLGPARAFTSKCDVGSQVLDNVV